MIKPEITLKEAQGKTLYLQAGEATPINVSLPITSLLRMQKYYGAHFPFWVAHVKNNYLTNYVSQEGMRELALFFLDKQKKDSKYVVFIEQTWKKSFAPLQKTVSLLQTLDFSTLSEKELLTHLQTLSQQGAEQWCPLIFIDAFDAEGNQFLELEIQKHAPHLLSEIGLLTTPPEMSYSQREKLAFLQLAHTLLKKKEKNIVLAAKKVAELPPYIQKLLVSHEQQFYWSKNNYAHIHYVDAQFFLEELQKLILSSSEGKIQDEIHHI